MLFGGLIISVIYYTIFGNFLDDCFYGQKLHFTDNLSYSVLLVVVMTVFFVSSHVVKLRNDRTENINHACREFYSYLKYNPFSSQLEQVQVSTVKGRGIAVRLNTVKFEFIGGHKLKNDAEIDVGESEALPGNSFGNLPSKADYVVYFRHDLKIVGSYTGAGGAAYQHNVEVAIVDLHTKKLVAKEFFAGGMPPAKKIASGNDAVGDYPKGIDVWIKGHVQQ